MKQKKKVSEGKRQYTRRIDITDNHGQPLDKNPPIFHYVEIQINKWFDFQISSLCTNVTLLRTNLIIIESCSPLWSASLSCYIVTKESITF